MLHITNGDCAVEGIQRSGVPGDVLPWRDVLHEGPVPGGLELSELSALRAGYLAGGGYAGENELLEDFRVRDRALAGAGAADEVVLWFEHDLYDQLQLIQLLDWFCEHPS